MRTAENIKDMQLKQNNLLDPLVSKHYPELPQKVIMVQRLLMHTDGISVRRRPP